MTCICGMVRDGEVYMAGDLMGSNGFTGKVYPDSKVFTNGDFIIGYTSSFRMGQILEWNWEPPLRQEGISDREYMQLNVIESLRETFAVYGYGIKEGLESLGGNFLIGYRGNLYEMQDNFSLLKIEDFVAVGSGGYHAEAALYLMYEDLENHPFAILSTAIATAAHFTQSVSEECTLFSSDESAVSEWNSLITQSMSEGENNPPEDVPTVYCDTVTLSFDKIRSATTVDSLKKYADILEISYAHNIGIEKLRKRILDYLESE